MDCQEYFSSKGDPIIDGTYYAYWSTKMRTYLMDLGSDIWRSIIIGYQAPTTLPTYTIEKNLYENNEKATYAILCGLPFSDLEKIMHYESTKDIQEKLQNIYEDGDQMKKVKLQSQKERDESLRVKEENETIFKASKVTKNKEHKSSHNYDNNVKKIHPMKKGMFPFNCFNCGKVGHFVAKCSFGKNGRSDDNK